MRDVAADREAQPGAAELARRAGIGLAERFEDQFELLGAECRSRCRGSTIVTCSPSAPGSRRDETWIDPAWVNLSALDSRLNTTWRSRAGSLSIRLGAALTSRSNVEPLGARLILPHPRHVAQHRGQIDRRAVRSVRLPVSILATSRMSSTSARIDTPAPCTTSIRSRVAGVELLVGQHHLRHAEDAVERRADLVAGRRQEFGLGRQRLAQRGVGRGEIDVGGAHLVAALADRDQAEAQHADDDHGGDARSDEDPELRLRARACSNSSLRLASSACSLAIFRSWLAESNRAAISAVLADAATLLLLSSSLLSASRWTSARSDRPASCRYRRRSCAPATRPSSVRSTFAAGKGAFDHASRA